MSWSQIEVFLHVARAGSLSAAAQTLGCSQPTLSRRISSFEASLGVQLFVRHTRGLELTERGADLLQQAQGLEQHVSAFMRRASGLREAPEGTVRISAAEPIAAFALPPALAALRQSHPSIDLEVVVDNSAANLSRREADIAIRMFRPTQLDLVAKRIGAVELGLYGSEAYLARDGLLTRFEELSNHTLIGFDRDTFWLDGLRRLELRPELFAARTDSILAQVRYVLAGVGLGALHVPLAARYSELTRVMPQLPLGRLELWLVVHSDVRQNPAVRAVLQLLEAHLLDYLAQA